MEFQGVKYLPVTSLGLSQIYLNSAKIEAIAEWFDPGDLSNFEPLPVHDFGDGAYTLTDGHTRAYVAYKSGVTSLPVVYDRDEIITCELGQLLYREDIRWCARFGLADIRDFEQRILSDEDYKRLWHTRCDRSQALLSKVSAEERSRLQAILPNLYLYGASEDLTEFFYEDGSGESYTYSAEELRRRAQ